MEASIHERRRRRDSIKQKHSSSTGKHMPAAPQINAVKATVKTVAPRRSHEGPRREGGAAVEGRKSVSHLETNVHSVAAFLQVKVMAADMPGFMQVHAFRCARGTYDSLEKSSHKHMAYGIKKEFDRVYGRPWHCIVGSSFGSFVTHSTGCFLYFSMEKIFVLVFKTRVVGASMVPLFFHSKFKDSIDSTAFST
ncbi:uncharacterized protein [Aristolochia californica]|uniref:uncharacterized protein n=1 Tax=Aristolochia californica TaxID=171875 RepID=UPI0035DEB5E4